MRFAWMLILALGCADPQADPLPADMVDAILNPAEDIPPPPEESPLGAAVESYLDKAAADAALPRVEVEMLTASWCGPCKSAKAKIIPWLEDQGYIVLVTDCSELSGDDLAKAYGVNAIPAFFFRDGKTHAKVVGPRYDTKGNVYAPDFAAAIKAFPPPLRDTNAVSLGISVPAISVADLTEGVRGMDQDLFGVVHVTIPEDVSWAVTKKPASVLLTFTEGKRPSLRSLRYVRANPNLLSVEVSPYWAEFKTDSYWPMLKTVRVEFDWSPPSAVKTIAGRQRYYYRPQPQYRPVPQAKPKPVVEEQPTPAEPPEPVTLGKSVPVIVPVAHAWRSTVCVYTTSDKLSYSLMGVPSVSKCKGWGSGMIASSDGHIITNAHVIEGTATVEVEFCDGQKRPAKVVGVDSKADIAVLKVHGVDLPVVKFATGNPMVGCDVYLTGNSLGYGESVTRGIVSALNRDVDTGHGEHKGLIQVDTQTNPGNSGGPVVNSKGEVIGVMVAMHSQAQGISFCIPADQAQAVYERLVQP